MYRYRTSLMWLGIYLLLALVPLGIVLAGEQPTHRGFWVELGAALGFIGLAMMAMQSLFSGRYSGVAPGLGADNVLNYHRQAGVLAVMMVLAHPLIMLLADPGYVAFLDPREETLRAIALILLIVASVLVIASSLWRLSFGLNYERWRLLHGLLALFLVAGGLGHALMVENYLEPLWRQALLVLFLGLLMYLVVHTRLVRPWLAGKRPFEVVDLKQERGDAWSLTLKPVDGRRFDFKPGQYAWFTLGPTPHALQQNPFSIASSARAGTLSFTAKEAGDFTRSLRHTRIGERAYVEGPFGSFSPMPGRNLFLIMGGIGITTAMGMLRTLRDDGDQRRVILLYCNPDWETLTFREELEGLRRTLNLELVYVLEDPPEGIDGERGFLDKEKLARYLPEQPERFSFFICGPDPLMDTAEVGLRDLGLDWRQILTERFQIV